jgi:hypothetical protein
LELEGGTQMKKIPLTKGMFAIVDDEDFKWLSQWKWNFSADGYAKRSQYVRLGKYKYTSKIIRMHRLVNQTPDGQITDHINRNKLDNRKENLRVTNKSQNGLNRGKNKNNTSGHKGIYWDSYSGKWKVELMVNLKKYSLGRYSNIKDAIDSRLRGEAAYGL